MKSNYFLPNNTGTDKFDSINDELKSVLSTITELVSFSMSKVSDFYPENYKNEIHEILFVPTIFDYRNGISYQGVEFALHWYFYLISLNNKFNFKIVLLGTEDKSAFFQNCLYSNFLKCPNVDYLQNNFEDITQYLLDYKTKEFDKKEALEKIDLIGIKPPTSYKSHHSIANEWSIIRWAKALKINTDEVEEFKKIENNIETSLYYNYLNTKYPISRNQKVNERKLINSGKILFIDDEVEKGWNIIFKKICTTKNYSSFGKDFKNWEQDRIINESFEKAKEADVVILDLRLHDNDFDEKDPKVITGYKLLKKIKEYNRGIQVIIFSATNKIWNLQAIQDYADGFIMKESPENSIYDTFTSHSIENIFDIIDKCLKMNFLSRAKIQLDQIKELSTKNEEYKDFFNDIDSDLEISFDLLINTKSSNKYFSYAFLQLFQIIENYINNENVFIEGDDSYVKLKNHEIYVQKRGSEKLEKSITLTQNGKYEIKQNLLTLKNKYVPTKRLDTNFKVSAVLIYKYGKINSSVEKWTDIYTIRNTKAAHYNPDNELKSNDIFMLIDFIKYFIDARNENDTNLNMGLKKKTYEESKELLLKDSGNFKVSKLKK